jgi:hypothetical protein
MNKKKELVKKGYIISVLFHVKITKAKQYRFFFNVIPANSNNNALFKGKFA